MIALNYRNIIKEVNMRKIIFIPVLLANFAFGA